MAVRLVCPECKTLNVIADAKRGGKIRCEQCDKMLTVPAGKKTDPDTAVQTKQKSPAKGPPRRSETEDSVDEARPRKKKDKIAAPKKGSSVMMLAVGGIAAFLCLIVIGGGYIAALFFAKGDSTPVVQVDPNKDKKIEADPNKDKNAIDPDKDKNKKPVDPDKDKKRNVFDPDKDKKKGDEKKQIVDDKKLPDDIGPATVRTLKQATVRLKVTMPNGQTAQGSGFLALQPGLVITNAHVLGMLRPSARMPKEVEVILHSGQAGERTMAGQLLGVDRESDLAVVRIPTEPALPTPVPLESDHESYETQRLYIFGFPFGTQFGKEITVSQTSISSFRKDNIGALEQIQVNGGMHPGNSGGPVVNTRGKLVGVCVAGVMGTQINFAVPGEKVQQMMEGRLAEANHGEAFAKDGKGFLPAEFKFLDPLAKIQNVRIEVWTGKPGTHRPHSFEKPKPMDGDSERMSHAVGYQNQLSNFDVPLPACKPGEVCWVQPVMKTTKGEQWGPARATTPDMVLLERVPANLTVSFTAQPERTARLSSVFTSSTTIDKKKRTYTERVEAEMLEVLDAQTEKGAKLGRIQTAVGLLNFNLDRDGVRIPLPEEARTVSIVRGMPPQFLIDESNGVFRFTTVTLKTGHPLREIVSDLNGMLHTPLEAATVRMPNKDVKPLDKFPTRSTIMIRSEGGKNTMIDLMMTCVYEGKRKKAGREEAVLTVTGRLQGRKELISKIDGKVTGKIAFDIAGGYLANVRLRILIENEDTIPGLGTYHRLMQQNITVDRVAGNPKQLVLNKVQQPPPNVSAGKTILNVKESVTAKDPIDPSLLARGKKSRMKVHPFEMEAGKSYIISLNSKEFDTFLRLEDPQGKEVAEDDDSGGGLNSKIVYRAAQKGAHKIIVTSFDSKLGAYELIVQEGTQGGAPVVVGDAPPKGWREVSPKFGTFSIWFPADGKLKETEDSAVSPGIGQIRVFNAITERRDGAVFFASQINLPPKLVKSTVKVRQDFFRDSFIAGIKGKLLEEKAAKGDIYSGRDYLIQTPNGMARFRLLGAGVQMYRLIVVGTNQQVQSPDAQLFFHSFKRVSRVDPNPPKKDPVAEEKVPPAPPGTRVTRLAGRGITDFRDDAPAGGLLIGFDFGLGKFGNQDTVAAIRPIYRDAKGKDIQGQPHGTKFERTVTVKAKAGYAVGGIDVNAGLWLNKITVTFMRVKEGKDVSLDPADSYASEPVGGNGGGRTKLGGDGTVVTGIIGKIAASMNCDAIGLVLGAPGPVKPPVPGNVVNPAPNVFFKGDVVLSHLTFGPTKKGKLAGDLIWAKDGKSFYALFDNGILQHIDVSTGQASQYCEIGSECFNLAMSAEGLLVSVPSRDEVLVLDPAKLTEVRKRIGGPFTHRVIASVTSATAYNISDDRAREYTLSVLDLKEGKIAKTKAMQEAWLLSASPDGKYLFAVGGIEQLLRINFNTLEAEDSSYRISTNGRRICFSPDGQYVALCAGGGNGRNHPDHPPVPGPYSTFVYPVTNLKKPVTGFAAGAYPSAVGIDPKSGLILTQRHDKPLILYPFDGDKISEHNYPIKGNYGVVEFAVSPAGGEALVRVDNDSIIHVRMIKGTAAPATKKTP